MFRAAAGRSTRWKNCNTTVQGKPVDVKVLLIEVGGGREPRTVGCAPPWTMALHFVHALALAGAKEMKSTWQYLMIASNCSWPRGEHLQRTKSAIVSSNRHLGVKTCRRVGKRILVKHDSERGILREYSGTEQCISIMLHRHHNPALQVLPPRLQATILRSDSIEPYSGKQKVFNQIKYLAVVLYIIILTFFLFPSQVK